MKIIKRKEATSRINRTISSKMAERHKRASQKENVEDLIECFWKKKQKKNGMNYNDIGNNGDY